MPVSTMVNPRAGSSFRAKIIAAKVALQAGAVFTVPGYGLLAPITGAKSGGNANLSLDANSLTISAAVALAADEEQSINGTLTGADGCVLPFTANLVGETAPPTVSISFVDGAFLNADGAPGQWYADGAAVAGASGASWTPSDMADVYGRAVWQVVGGKTSNVLLVEADAPPMTHIDFSGAEGTKLSALPNHPFEVIDDGTNSPLRDMQVLDGAGLAKFQATITGQSYPAAICLQDTGAPNHRVIFKAGKFPIDTGLRQIPMLMAAVEDYDNYIYFTQNAPDILNARMRIAGVGNIPISTVPGVAQPALNVPGLFNAGTKIEIEVRAGKFQCRVNDLPYSLAKLPATSVQTDVWYDLPSELLALGGTKVGLRSAGGSGTLAWADDMWFGALDAPISLTISNQARSPDDPNKTRVTMAGIYNGITAIEYLVLLADGTLVQNWTAEQAISGGTLAQHLDIPLTTGETYTIVARDPNEPATATKILGTAPVLSTGGDARAGMNESEVSQYNSVDPFTELGSRIEWRTPGYDYIRPRGTRADSPHIATSADGEGGTVKMDMDGTIHGYNTAGLTEYLIATPFYYSEPGDYILTLAPGLTVTRDTGVSSWSYNSATGELTYTVESTGSTTNNYKITCASIPPSGIKARLRKSGTTPVGFELRTLPLASLPQVSNILRNMSSSRINDWVNTEGGRTDLALPVDTPSNVAPGSGASDNARKLLAYAEAGQDLWVNTFHTAGDELIAADAAYLAGNTDQIVYSELTNEDWNPDFTAQNKDSYLAGYRRGYGPSGVNTHAEAVPETIIDGRRYIDRTSLLVSGRSFEPGDKVYVDQNGVGYLVYSVTATINPGDTLTPGTNATLVYDQSAAARAQLKWLGRRSKEMWALQDAAFATSGKPRPVHVLAWQHGAGFNAIKTALDFDEVYKVVDRVATAPYFGGDFGTYTDASWSQASRDKWYAGDTQGFIEDACAALTPVINAKIAEAVTYSNLLAAYSLLRRGDKNAIRLAFYEYGQHIQFSGWPDMAGQWSSGTLYRVGRFAYSNPSTGGDGQTYRCKVQHTNQPLSDTTYWEVFVDSNGDPWDATKTALHRNSAPRGYQAAWNALSRSPEFAERMGYYIQQMAALTGVKEMMFFDRCKRPTTGGSTRVTAMPDINGWGMMLNELDTDFSGDPGTNWQFKMLKEFKDSLESEGA